MVFALKNLLNKSLGKTSDFIHNNLDKKMKALGIFLDLKIAFDM